jgi:uncharacterized protein (DUF1778 family)
MEQQIGVSFTKQELASVLDKAKHTGISLTKFLVNAALHGDDSKIDTYMADTSAYERRNIKLTKEEKQKIIERAKEFNVTAGRFVRIMGLTNTAEIKVKRGR